MDFAFLLDLLVFIGFATCTIAARDDRFDYCFLGASTGFFCILICIVMKKIQGSRSPIAWLVSIVAVTLFMIFQSIRFQHLTRMFRPQGNSPNSETVFSFGQILVLFMIFPLVANFTAGMIGKLLKVGSADSPK